MEVCGRDAKGKPTGWEGDAPVEAIRFRKLENGKVKKRRGHKKGKLFQEKPLEGEEHDQLVALEDQRKVG